MGYYYCCDVLGMLTGGKWPERWFGFGWDVTSTVRFNDVYGHGLGRKRPLPVLSGSSHLRDGKFLFSKQNHEQSPGK